MNGIQYNHFENQTECDLTNQTESDNYSNRILNNHI